MQQGPISDTTAKFIAAVFLAIVLAFLIIALIGFARWVL